MLTQNINQESDQRAQWDTFGSSCMTVSLVGLVGREEELFPIEASALAGKLVLYCLVSAFR